MDARQGWAVPGQLSAWTGLGGRWAAAGPCTERGEMYRWALGDVIRMGRTGSRRDPVLPNGFLRGDRSRLPRPGVSRWRPGPPGPGPRTRVQDPGRIR